jgi:hypothetical protein
MGTLQRLTQWTCGSGQGVVEFSGRRAKADDMAATESGLGETALHIASRNFDWKVAKVLVSDAKADIMAQNKTRSAL